MRSLYVYGAKGGQGTSVVAASIALMLSRTQPTLLIDSFGDQRAVLGLGYEADDGHVRVTESLVLMDGGTASPDWPLASTPLRVYDSGEPGPDASVTRVLVVRNCFLALRRAMHMQGRPDFVVAVMEPNRSLTEADIKDVTGFDPVITVDYDVAISRAVDAGILATRLPKQIERMTALLATSELEQEEAST